MRRAVVGKGLAVLRAAPCVAGVGENDVPPPVPRRSYGREIGPWVEKARREAERGALVVGLLPARTDTVWFHEYVYRAATEIRFLKGRLKFEGAAASAPFPSMIAVWGKV